MSRSRLVAFALVAILVTALPVRAAEPFKYEEGKHGKGQLKYINGLPVLMVEGTPEQIGEQVGGLTSKSVDRLMSFPKLYIEKFGYGAAWNGLVRIGKSMEPGFPADHLKELEATVKAAGVNRNLAIVGNTFADIKKIGGCSTLAIDAAHSATRGPLMGRNLDYPTLGFLHQHTLVTVCKPNGKHAFASIGFPGFVGCLSGMNDAGLCIAVLEIYSANDDSKPFDATGTPYALCYRRILEECTTVAEAEKLIRSMKRTTRNSLAVCDRETSAVFELTPKSVVVRKSEDGLCACTNHFRTKELCTDTACKRYTALEKVKSMSRVDIPDLMKLMHSVNQGDNTFQTMIFEPKTLKLHLCIGELPSSKQEPKLLELAELFKKK
jgi:isopenicillin-N N-acyltransferase-like protein